VESTLIFERTLGRMSLCGVRDVCFWKCTEENYVARCC